VLYLLCILYCTLGLAFSACEVLLSSTVGGAIQIIAVIVIAVSSRPYHCWWCWVSCQSEVSWFWICKL